jgi:hypothetical protein
MHELKTHPLRRQACAETGKCLTSFIFAVSDQFIRDLLNERERGRFIIGAVFTDI